MKDVLSHKFLPPLLVILFALLLQAAANAQVLSLETTASKTDIFTRESVVYTLKYACSGSTQNCTNVTMTGTFPDKTLQITGSTTTSDIVSYTISANGRSITYTFREPLPSGSTGTIEMTAIGSSYALDNTVGTLTSSILTGGTPSQTNTTNVTLHAADKFCAQKLNATGLGLDNTTTYRINLSYNTTNGNAREGIGTQSVGNVTVVDQLPPGTIIESATWSSINGVYTSGNCSIDAANARVTCNMPASALEIQNSNVPATSVLIRVKYPSTTFAASQTVVNTATVSYTAQNGSQVILTDGTTRTYQDGTSYQNDLGVNTTTCTALLQVSDVLQSPNSQLKLAKGVYSNRLKVGQASAYPLFFENTGNTTLTNLVIDDILPPAVYVTSIPSDINSFNMVGDENIRYWVTTKTNPTFTQIPLVPYGTAYTVAVGDTITAFRITADILRPNAGQNGLNLNFTVNPTSATVVQNCLIVQSATGGTTLDPTSTTCTSFSVLPADNFASLSIEKRAIGVPNNINSTFASVKIGDVVWMALRATNQSGGQALANPVIMDLLPKGANYDGNILYGDNTPAPTNQEIIPNYNNTGRTLVRLRWSTPMPAGVTYQITIKTRITSLMTAGNPGSGAGVFYSPYADAVQGFKNTGFVTGTNKQCKLLNTPNSPVSYVVVADIYDLNGDGSTTDSLCYHTTAVPVVGAASMESIKWVKGQLDADYSRYPASGNTVPGGKADYRLVVKNTGNVPMKDVKIIDILPFVGDGGVIDLSPRNTAWRPNLADPITAPAGITVYYSIAANPCRDEMKATSDPSPFPAGCTPPNWSATPPSDITKVQSVKLDFGTLIVQPGDSLEFTWPMRAPIDAPATGEIAWNSFGFVATRTDNNQPLLAAEPAKVGIRVQAGQPGFYGDLVWFDTNRNGVQDAGEQGVDGIKVKLFNPTTNTANPATDPLWAFTITGNGGKYLFSNLPPGNYYAVFCLPDGYSTSPRNATSNTGLDSDGTPITYDGGPATIVSVTDISAGETDLTWDQGIYCSLAVSATAALTTVPVGGTISLSASGGTSYLWSGPNGFSSTLPNPTKPNATTADAGVYTVLVSNGTCSVPATITITIGQPCSLSATATPGLCASATNSYSVTGIISLTNATGGTATITDGIRSTMLVIPNGATSVAYSLTGLTSGTGSHTVTVTLPGCGRASQTYTAPVSCVCPPSHCIPLSIIKIR